jgi:dTDP-4-dehydrorhamnose reductase
MSRALILGKGFVGTKLKKYFDDLEYRSTLIGKTDLNYTKPHNLIDFIIQNKISAVVNCSGYTGTPNVDACESNKEICWLYNVVIPNIITKVCKDLGVPCIHVSSGCIYTGYEKRFIETDIPNFGLYYKESSFYSKTKHAFETIADLDYAAILRIRMPFTDTLEPKNYLYKILKYDNLISFDNSLTSIDDLNNFIFKLIQNFKPGIYNVVNTEPTNAKNIVEIFKQHNVANTNWSFVDMDKLNIIAGRSNCVLATAKIAHMGAELSDTHATVDKCIYNISKLL